MRRTLLAMVVTIVVAASACAPAAPAVPAGPTPAEMMAGADALDARFLAAFNKGDAEALADTYWNSPDLVSIGPDGMGVRGWASAKAGAGEMFKAMPGATLEYLTKHNDVHGDVVIGSGTWKMTIPTPGGHQVMEGRFSDVKAMRDGKWVFVMDHASVPLPPPPPAK
ncbi:MAG TPA: nuclear transport factor 2 family protein [Vicinamibacterales bacterium]|nr:nuclear transport factor 2 family protein [Acidobacteriota bacterium]HQX83357.1 nuclear transport factor 2 family protein [Vicinamibacterales bacterium]